MNPGAAGYPRFLPDLDGAGAPFLFSSNSRDRHNEHG